MRTLFCCLVKNDEGVSAIEFAIISPVLLTIMLGIFQFGVAMNQYFESHQRGGPGRADIGAEPRHHDALYGDDDGDHRGGAQSGAGADDDNRHGSTASPAPTMPPARRRWSPGRRRS